MLTIMAHQKYDFSTIESRLTGNSSVRCNGEIETETMDRSGGITNQNRSGVDERTE